MKTVQGMEFTVEEDLCEGRFIDALKIDIADVLGSADSVKDNESFLVRGEYAFSEDRQGICAIILASYGSSEGRPARLDEQVGPFDLEVNVVTVAKNRNRVLDLLMLDDQGKHLGIRLRIHLAAPPGQG